VVSLAKWMVGDWGGGSVRSGAQPFAYSDAESYSDAVAYSNAYTDADANTRWRIGE